MLAQVLRQLGSRHVMLVHADGLDELSIAGPSEVVELHGRTDQPIPDHAGGFRHRTSRRSTVCAPIRRAPVSKLVNQSLDEPESAAAQIVALNAGAAIYVSRGRDVVRQRRHYGAGRDRGRAREGAACRAGAHYRDDGRDAMTGDGARSHPRAQARQKWQIVADRNRCRALMDARANRSAVARIRGSARRAASQRGEPRGHRRGEESVSVAKASSAQTSIRSQSRKATRQPVPTCLSVLTDENVLPGSRPLPASTPAQRRGCRRCGRTSSWIRTRSSRRARSAPTASCSSSPRWTAELLHECHACARRPRSRRADRGSRQARNSTPHCGCRPNSSASTIAICGRSIRRLSTTYDLLPEIPNDTVVVTESGIHDRAQVAELRARGVQRFPGRRSIHARPGAWHGFATAVLRLDPLTARAQFESRRRRVRRTDRRTRHTA